MKDIPATQKDRPARRRPAPAANAWRAPARTPSMLDLLFTLIAALLGNRARTPRTSWHYTQPEATSHDTSAVAGPIPRPLRRGSPDIIIARAHAGPRRRTRTRPAPPHAPATTARAPPALTRTPTPHTKTPPNQGAPPHDHLVAKS